MVLDVATTNAIVLGLLFNIVLDLFLACCLASYLLGRDYAQRRNRYA